MRLHRSLWLRSIIFAAGVFCLLFLSQALLPRFSEGLYAVNGEKPRPFSLPLVYTSRGEDLRVAVDVYVPAIHVPAFDLLADDCMQRLEVNGQEAAVGTPFCDSIPRRIRLDPPLRAGWNRVIATVRDGGGAGAFSLHVAHTDPVFLALLLLGISLCGWYVHAWYGRFAALRRLGWVFPVAAGGVLLRWLYLLSTLIYVRAHDWDNEIGYIRYLLEHARVPPVSAGGLEYFQPPLYFALGALWMRIGEAFGRSFETLLLDLQKGSFLLSLGTLVIAAWIGLRLLRAGKRRQDSALFLALAASVPGVVYLTTVINNDAFAGFMSFLSFALLLAWWQGGKTRHWIAAAIVIGAGILGKNTVLPMAGVAGLCLLAKRIPWREKFHAGSLFLVILIALTGWLYALRMQENTSFIGNADLLDPALRLNHTVSHTLRFHPLQVLRHPYNSPTGAEEEKEYFLEYLFRSSFFGEYVFDAKLATLTYLMLLFGMAGLAFTAVGLGLEKRERFMEAFPVFAALVGLLLFLFVGRLIHPFSIMQDFRYVPLLAVPLSYYAVRGTQTRFTLLNRFGTSILWMFVVLEALFITSLFFFAH